jgi:DNA-binding MarR family transcriptional regulator
MENIVVENKAQKALAEKSAEIKEFNQTNILRVVRQVVRHMNAAINSRLESNGFGDLSARHLSVFEFLDIEGTNIVTLARRAGVTKQAMSKFVREVKDGGYVNVDRDTKDTRVWYVTLTKKGFKLMDVMQNEIKSMGETIKNTGLISAEETAAGFNTLTKLLNYFEQNHKAAPSEN